MDTVPTQVTLGDAGPGGASLTGTFQQAHKIGTSRGEGVQQLGYNQLLAARGVNPDRHMPPPARRRRRILTRQQFDQRVKKAIAAGSGVPEGLEQELYICTSNPQLGMMIVQGVPPDRDGRGALEAIKVKFGKPDNPEAQYWTPNFDDLVAVEHDRLVNASVEPNDENRMLMARQKAAHYILIIKEHLSPEGLAAWHADYADKITKFEKPEVPTEESKDAAAIARLAERGYDVRGAVAALKDKAGIRDSSPPVQSGGFPSGLSSERLPAMRGKPGARGRAGEPAAAEPESPVATEATAEK